MPSVTCAEGGTVVRGRLGHESCADIHECTGAVRLPWCVRVHAQPCAQMLGVELAGRRTAMCREDGAHLLDARVFAFHRFAQ